MVTDAKALKILKKYNPYQNKLKPEEIEYGIEKGVLFEQENLTHDEIIKEIKQLSSEIKLEDTVRAFLYSISSGENVYRTALSSLIWAKSLQEHDCIEKGRGAGLVHYYFCEVCSAFINGESNNICNDFNRYNRYRYFSGELDICLAGYVLLDLREFKKLPKVDYCDEDIKILNRIFGLVKELGSANKASALQKLITAEKTFKATKNEINSILGVLSICGVFDTPEHKSCATKFVPNNERGFESECDLFYPLNFWRAKYGVNYEAVDKIFGNITGGKLSPECAICGKVQRDFSEKKVKKSKAEQYFTDGEHSLEISNEQRYYYGLAQVDPSWEKQIMYSVTYNTYKRSELYFDGNTLKKIIYEEKTVFAEEHIKEGERDVEIEYTECDMNVETIDRRLVVPKTKRGTEQPLTPSLLLTPTYMCEQLCIMMQKDNSTLISSFNSCNDQYLPLPDGNISSQLDFEKYTADYIENLPDDYDEVIENFHNKKRATVDIRPGDIFRVHLTPKKYTYGIILAKVRDILKWSEIPEHHPIRGVMCQPVMYRQYDIVTEDKNLTVDDLKNIPLRPMNIAQDNYVLWETYPIIGNKKLEESDVDLGFAFTPPKGEDKNGIVVWGFSRYEFEGDKFPELNNCNTNFNFCYSTTMSICLSEKPEEWMINAENAKKIVAKTLGFEDNYSLDDFANKFGGITRKEFIRLLEERV